MISSLISALFGAALFVCTVAGDAEVYDYVSDINGAMTKNTTNSEYR